MKQSHGVLMTAGLFVMCIVGCSHPLEITGNGDIWSSSGERNCSLEEYESNEEGCTVNGVALAYDETYMAEPGTGWKFDGWENCQTVDGLTCSFAVPAEAVVQAWGEVAPPLVALFTEDETVFSAPPSDCAWQGPYVKEHPVFDFAYLDRGAAYWSVSYVLPEDSAYLTFEADFPYARYMSFNAYNRTEEGRNVPVQAIADNEIVPEPGSVNPFIDGNQRNGEDRRYFVTVMSGEPPVPPLPDNTLYDATPAGERAAVLLRNYVWNDGSSWTGDVGLPRITLHLPGGETMQGQEACDELQVSNTAVENATVVPALYQYLRTNFQPAKNPPTFRANYNFTFMVQCDYQGNCDQTPEREVGSFASLHNSYVYSFLDREYGEVAVIRGRIPQTPLTRSGGDVFSDGELRYWSMCQYEFFSQKIEECLIDEDVPINPDGFFTIITGLEGDRPSNATEDCGVGFIPWPEDGDGFEFGGGTNDLDASFLLMRNMLPADDFDMAIANTETPGDEEAVLGEFLPKATYMSKSEFEALGCDSYLAIPYGDL